MLIDVTAPLSDGPQQYVQRRPHDAGRENQQDEPVGHHSTDTGKPLFQREFRIGADQRRQRRRPVEEQKRP
ncbi:hypothetical protein [Streptomyces bacillaris]|uniref:hypothetical protein n=1 Tax=Streptomyces bacillaris TaxID=68179 RepID=UPI0013A695A7